MARFIEDTVWAGSEASLQSVLDAQEAIASRLAAGVLEDENDDEEGSRLLAVQDGVGVITIKGSLVNSGSYWNRYFGITGYPEIRDAMIEAANNPDVREILLDIDSGGGAVAGVSDTGSLIRLVNDRLKPVSAFTDGAMASAAYWLGASAGKVYSGRMAVVGSIGVIATHMERSKQLAEAGIGVTVVRSGKFKALVNGVEPLSEEGRRQLQAQVDAADAVFVEHVAAMRGRSVDYTRENMAQGREFIPEDAQRVGLIDGVMTFDTLMSDLKEKVIAKSKNFMENRGNAGRGFGASVNPAENGDREMGKKSLTEQDIAALAAGASLEAGAVSEDERQAEAGAETQAEAEGEARASAAGEGAEVEAGAPEVAAGVQEVAKSDEAVRLLKEQLKAAQDELLDAKIEQRKATEKLAELEQVVAPMAQIVGKAINNMQVALGGTALDLTAMAPAALVAEHGRMVEQFQSKFKAGGVAAVDAAREDEAAPKLAPFHKARVSAVRFNQKK